MARKSKSKGGKSTSGFITNLRKSAGSLAKDTAKDLMPNLSSTIKNNARFVKTTYKDTSSKFRETDLKESFLFKSGNDLIKNALSDIKTGNINNKERQQKNSQDPFAKLLNFDFDSEDDLSDMFADDKSAPEDGLSDLSNLSLNLDEDTKNDIKAMANFSQANTKITNRGFAAMTTQLRSISAFQNQNTLKFYEMVEEKLNSLDSHMAISSAYYKDLVENTKRSQKDVKSNSLEAAFDMKGFNIEDYVEIYKENFKGMFEAGSMVGSMMIKPMIADIVNNPLGALGKMGMKSLIPKGIRKSLKDLDNSLGALPILLQGRIPSMKKKGGIWELFGNLLDLDKSRVRNKKNEFVKGPIPFDGVTKRAITHVIPGYLRRILVALTGNQKDNLVYDMDAGKFITAKESKRSYKERLNNSRRSAIDGNIDSLEKEYIKALKDKKVIKNDSEGADYLEELRQSLANLSKSGKTLSSDIKASDLSSNKKTAKIIKEVIDGLDSKSFVETNKAIANAYIQYQQEARAAMSEDLWSSTFDITGRVSRTKEKPNPIFDNIEKMGNTKADSLFKKFVLNKIKNEKLKEQLSWLDKETEDGKNETLEKFSERIMGNFRGEIEFDKSDFKKKKSKSNKKNQSETSAYLGILQMVGADSSDPAVKKVLSNISNGKDPSTFKATVNRLISGAKGGVNFANQGLMQYMTNTPEGLALRVKIADGTTVPTTEGPNDPKTVEKNIRTRIKAESKVNKSDGKVINLGDYKKKSSSTSASIDSGEMEQNLPMVVGGEEINSIIENPNDPRYTIFGELFRDVTGSDLTKAGIGGLVFNKFRRAVGNTKYGDIALKYGDRAYEYGKEYAKDKNLWEKFKSSSLGKGFKSLNDGATIFSNKVKDKGLAKGGALFATGLDLLNFASDRTGVNKDSLMKNGKDALNYTGDTLGNLIGGVGDVLGGKTSVKDGAKSLLKGSWSTLKTVKGATFKGLGKVGNIFKNGGIKEISKIIKTKRNRVKPTEDPATNLLLASNNMTESVSNSAQVLQLTTTSVATTIVEATEKMTDKLEDVSNAIEVSSYRIVESNDSEGGLVENVIGEVISESVGGKAGKLSKLAGLFGKGKGLLGKGAKDLLGKGTSLLGKAFGAAKGAGVLGKLGGLASGAGSLLAGGGSALAGLAGAATPLLAGLAPVLGPALAIGAGAFGIGKIFKGIKKRREEKKAQKEAERAQYYDENGNYKTDSEGYSTEKRGFFSRLFRPFGHKPDNNQLDKLNEAVPVTVVNSEKSEMEIEQEKELKFGSRGIISGMKNGLSMLNPLSALNPMSPQMGMMSPFKSLMAHTPAGMMAKGFSNMFVKTAYADGNSSTAGPVDSSSKEGLISTDPNTRTTEYVKPWGEYVMSPTFGNIFGASGLFGAMYKGLKKAAGGGGVSKLTEFFQKFWENSLISSGSGSPDGTVEYGIDGELMTDDNFLGMYTHKHEGDVDTISSGKGDFGGVSYGISQFPSKNGTPDAFVKWMKNSPQYKDLGERFGNAKQLTPEFDRIWKDIAKTDRERFKQAQLRYTYEKDMGTFLKSDKSGVDWNRSRALQEMVYSLTTIGPGTMLSQVKKAGVNNSMSDEEIITRVYDTWAANANQIWRSSSKSVQESGRQRMIREKKIILDLAKTGRAPIDWKGDGSIKGAESPSSGSGGKSSNATIQKALTTAKAMIDRGYPYKMEPGATNPSYGAFDCSGLMQYSYGQAGIKLPRTAHEQSKVGRSIPIAGQYGLANALPGDLLACRRRSDGKVGHIMMYAGNNHVYEAANPRTGLVHRHVKNTNFKSDPISIRRIVESGNSKSRGLPESSDDTNMPTTATAKLMKEYSKYDYSQGSIRAKVGESIKLGRSTTRSTSNIGGLPEGDSISSTTNTRNSYSVTNNQSFRDEVKNSLMLKIKDTVEAICQNTGKTNEILANILQKITESANIDSPLKLDAELASIYRGF